MKKLIYLLPLFILLMTNISCDTSLQTKPRDFLTPDNAYNDEIGVDQGITGLYANIRKYFYSNRFANFQAYGLYGLGTDATFDGESPEGERFMTNYATSVIPDNVNITSWWRVMYKIIDQSNTIIEKINNIKKSSADSSKLNVPMAETRFFRAYSYRLAVTLWGDVPLVTKPIMGQKTDFVRDPKKKVYKQMEKDLMFATKNLPVPGSESAPGKLTQGAAWQLLTKVYLGEHKYKLAVEAASKVIDGYNYHLMTDTFGSQRNIMGQENAYSCLFNYDNQNANENTETIWAIQHEPNTEGGGGNAWATMYSPRYSKWGKTPDGYDAYRTTYQDSLGHGVARSRPTNLVSYGVWKNDWDDMRNAKVNIKRKFYFDNPKSKYDGQVINDSLYEPGVRNVVKDTMNYIFPFFLKTFSPVYQAQTLGINPSKGGGGTIYTDFYAMRLAETYLLRAEAYVNLDKKDKAAKDINAVRNRAHTTPVKPADVDIDYILDERIRELFAEEMRLIVLMRMDKLVERTRKYNDNPFHPGANIQNYNKLFPIPQQQIDLNGDAKFKQNPGY